LNPPSASTPTPAAPVLAEVRYSLPEMLREIALERSSQALAMEKLDQTEIAKLFSKPRPRRALKSRK
jgi:hypothetical protein